MTPETIAELRRLAEAATPRPWMVDDEGDDVAVIVDEGDEFSFVQVAADLHQGDNGLTDARLIVAAVNALPALLDAAVLLADVREQVARGALCPMCSTGMTRQTVGMVCQLCGTDYSRAEYASLRRDSEQTTKAAIAEALAVRAERDALAAKVERVRALHPRDDDMCCNCGQPHPCDTRAALDEEPQP